MSKPEIHAGTSKWFRVATEGATTDGRTISRMWIEQMAANYDPKRYGARVNLEHFRGILPDGPFKAYGDVLALKAEEVEDGKLGLFAQISPTQDLINLTNARQKIYTSIEVDPSFADTKQAYLVGLAVTDSPASLGTEILSFAAGAGDQNPFIARKQSPQNVFSEAIETVIEFEPTAASAPAAASIFSKVAELLGIVKRKDADDDTRFSDVTQAVEALATHGREQAERVEAFAARLEAIDAELQAEKKAREAADKAFAELTAKLAQEPGQQQRPTATGTNGVLTTDC